MEVTLGGVADRRAGSIGAPEPVEGSTGGEADLGCSLTPDQARELLTPDQARELQLDATGERARQGR
ncbi:MAG: hypothetical protein ACRCSN_03325 [Dermatophilaceae bacterium]